MTREATKPISRSRDTLEPPARRSTSSSRGRAAPTLQAHTNELAQFIQGSTVPVPGGTPQVMTFHGMSLDGIVTEAVVDAETVHQGRASSTGTPSMTAWRSSSGDLSDRYPLHDRVAILKRRVRTRTPL